MLIKGNSAVVVGPYRKTVITLDLDLYNRALQIQQTVGNTYYILRADVLHIVFAALHALAKQLIVVDLIHVQLKKKTYNLDSSVEFMVAKHTSEDRIPHHNQPINNDDAI